MLLTDVEDLSTISGTSAFQRKLVRDVDQRMDRIPQELITEHRISQTWITLKRKTATLALNVAEKIGSADSEPLEIATRLYMQVRNLAQRRANANPASLELQLDYVKAMKDLGAVFLRGNDTKKALDLYNQAFFFLQDLERDYPSNVAVQLALSDAHSRLGNYWWRTGARNLDQSTMYFERSEKICTQLAKAWPDDEKIQQSVRCALVDLGDVRYQGFTYTEALGLYKQAHRISLEYDKGDDDVRSRSAVAFTAGRISDAFEGLGDLASALTWAEQATGITEDLVKKNPDNLRQRHRLCYNTRDLGDIHRDLGNLDEARIQFWKGLHEAQRLVDIDSNDTDYKTRATHLLERLSELYAIYQEPPDLKEARRLINDKLLIDQTLIKQNPDHVQFKNDICWAYEKKGMYAMMSAELTQALDEFRKSIDLRTEVESVSPGDPQTRPI